MSTPTISRTAQSSELSRNSANVFKAAEEGPVRITRRDGEALVLLTSTEFDREHEGAELAAHLVAASLGDPQVPFVERLRGPFPWTGSSPQLLPTLTHKGGTFGRWQHELPGGARLWFYVDGQTVCLVDVHTHHPNATK